MQLFLGLLHLPLQIHFSSSSSICHPQLHPLIPLLGFSGSYCVNEKTVNFIYHLWKVSREHIAKPPSQSTERDRLCKRHPKHESLNREDPQNISTNKQVLLCLKKKKKSKPTIKICHCSTNCWIPFKRQFVKFKSLPQGTWGGEWEHYPGVRHTSEQTWQFKHLV